MHSSLACTQQSASGYDEQSGVHSRAQQSGCGYEQSGDKQSGSGMHSMNGRILPCDRGRERRC